MILFPNAKINLGLNIKNKCPDGYHEIATVMLPVDWHDILEIVPAEGDNSTLTVYGNKVECPAEDNLVMKAYNALNRACPIPPVDIYLTKIIPDGAGLGGGSSDAAFTLVGLNELFGLNLNDSQLADIASTLGADCPFFIYNRPMLATGTGTTLRQVGIDLSNYYISIVKPPVKVPTRDAYSGCSSRPWSPSIEDTITSGKLFSLINDFQSSVFPTYPSIRQIKDHLLDHGALYASMSGSGSAVFALFNKRDDAEKACAQLGQNNIVHIGHFI